MIALDSDRRIRNPSSAGDVRTRAPELKERERSERPRESIAKVGRVGEAVRDLSAIGSVDRSRGHHVVAGGVHRIPPADVGAGHRRVSSSGGLPEFFSLDQRVGLLPELNFAEISIKPAVSHDAVFGRRHAGEHAGLHGRGHCREDGPHRADPTTVTRERGDGRGVLTDQCGRETDQIDDGNAARHVRIVLVPASGRPPTRSRPPLAAARSSAGFAPVTPPAERGPACSTSEP